MRFRIIVAAALIATAPSPMQAQTMTRAECQKLARTVATATRSMDDIQISLSELDYSAFVSRAPNPEARNAFAKSGEASKAAAAAIRSFVTAMEDMSYQLQLCAR